MNTHKFYEMLFKKGLISKNQAIVRMNREAAIITGIHDSTCDKEFWNEIAKKDKAFQKIYGKTKKRNLIRRQS